MAVGVIFGNVRNVSVAAQSIDIVAVPAQSSLEQTFPIPNVALGDFIDVQPTQFVAGLIYGRCRCTVPGTVAMSLYNVTAALIDPGVQQFRFLIARPEGGVNVKAIIAD